jgi:hypothetical protein
MRLRLLALGIFMMCLTSCFDVFETFNIKEDGSGTYEIKMDMSRSVAMLSMMQQGNTDKPNAKLDSIIYSRSFIDTSSAYTAEEKAVLRNSYSKVHMNEEAGEMYVQLFYPFSNGKEFAVIQRSMTEKDGNKNMMDALSGAMRKQMAPPPGAMEGDQKAEFPTQDFNYSLTGSSLVRKIKPGSKPEQPKAEDEQIPAEVKEMMKMSYTTTVNLPRPVKSFKGNNGTLSADKKQLRFSKSIDLDSKVTPADFDFSIDY